jgi:hypothetical protein
MKYLEYTLETYDYSHCNMCNIPIYFCNTNIEHLQHTSEILETYVCNMLFERKHLLAASANGDSSAHGDHRCAHRRMELAKNVELVKGRDGGLEGG